MRYASLLWLFLALSLASLYGCPQPVAKSSPAPITTVSYEVTPIYTITPPQTPEFIPITDDNPNPILSSPEKTEVEGETVIVSSSSCQCGPNCQCKEPADIIYPGKGKYTRSWKWVPERSVVSPQPLAPATQSDYSDCPDGNCSTFTRRGLFRRR